MRGNRLMIIDFGYQKGARMVFKKGIDRLNQFGSRTPVVKKGKSMMGLAGGLQIGKYIGPAEPVNGLFGIADHHQNVIGSTKQDFEDLILRAVGILEFVHQGGPVAEADGRSQTAASIASQGLGGPRQQVIVKDRLTVLFEAFEFAVGIGEKTVSQGRGPFFQGRLQLPGRLA